MEVKHTKRAQAEATPNTAPRDAAEHQRLEAKKDRTRAEANAARDNLDRLIRRHAPHEVIGPAIDETHAREAEADRASHSCFAAEDYGGPVYVGWPDEQWKAQSKRFPKEITLTDFLEDYCEGPLTEARIDSIKNSIQSAARRRPNPKIVLPPLTRQWHEGQRKFYDPTALIERWPEYGKKLGGLPDLRPEYRP